MSRRTTIKCNDLVRSADGVEYRVTALYNVVEGHLLADLVPVDNGAGCTLPVAELTRIGRPRPPVENMPSPRPRCERCDKPLRYWTDDTRRNGYVVRRVFTKWIGYGWLATPSFCTLTCALSFAVLALEAGYRIRGPRK